VRDARAVCDVRIDDHDIGPVAMLRGVELVLRPDLATAAARTQPTIG
jgi:hypothetical protein